MINKILLIFLILLNLVNAKSITYEQVVDATFEHDFQLKIINSNKNILQANIDLLKTKYYPIFSLSLNTQYTKNLQAASSALDSIFYDKTEYESSATLELNYDLYDFGNRNETIFISKINKKLITPQLKEKKQELKLKLLGIYGEILKDKVSISLYKKINQINKDIYLLKKRLYQANEIDKTEVSSQSILIVDLDVDIQSIQDKLKNNIDLISFYTHSNYDANTQFKLLNIINKKNLEYNDTYIKEKFSLLIEQKYAELKLLKTQQYPTIKLFSTYNFNAQDEKHIKKSFNLDEKDYVIGLGFNVNLFEGFKYRAHKYKVKSELYKLFLEDEEQKELFYKNKHILNENVNDIDNNNEKLVISKMENTHKFNMIRKLHETKNINSIVMLENKITLINKELKLKIAKIEKSIKLKEMNIYGFNKIYKKIVEKKKFKKTIKNENLFIVRSKTANIRNSPYLTGDIVDVLNYKDIINIEYCNEFNWCKISNKEQYIAKFLIETTLKN